MDHGHECKEPFERRRTGWGKRVGEAQVSMDEMSVLSTPTVNGDSNTRDDSKIPPVSALNIKKRSPEGLEDVGFTSPLLKSSSRS